MIRQFLDKLDLLLYVQFFNSLKDFLRRAHDIDNTIFAADFKRGFPAGFSRKDAKVAKAGNAASGKKRQPRKLSGCRAGAVQDASASARSYGGQERESLCNKNA